MKTARISSFESFATLDGKGIRFAIFFQGCPLRCSYCHNPETWDINSCSAQILTSEELLKKTLRFVPYFSRGGGVTLSGGEPLLQSDFLLEFAALLKKENIHITLDTSGGLLNEKVEKLLDFCDEVMLDLKFHDEELHLKHTGVKLIKILNFLGAVNKKNIRTTLKTVIVPNINDTNEDIEKYVSIAKKHPCVHSYQLLGFHTLGTYKYEKLGLENPLKNTLPLKPEKLKELQAFLDSIFPKGDIST